MQRFTRKKDDEVKAEYKKYMLLKLEKRSIKRVKVVITILYVILILFFLYANTVVKAKNLGDLYSIFIYIGTFLTTFNLCDIWFKNRSLRTIHILGDADDLLRTYQKMIFDMNMSLVSFDSKTREIRAYLNGNELSIAISYIMYGNEKMVKVIIASESDFAGVVLHYKELIKNIRIIVNSICYPEI